jgi:uncharacterized protein HemX
MKKIVYFILLSLILGLVLLLLKQTQNVAELQQVVKNAQESEIRAKKAEKMALIKEEQAITSKLESEKALEKTLKELQMLKLQKVVLEKK